MNLVIVESPTKARTISRFLGSDYTIKASMGHVIDLPKSKIGIDFDHGFTPLYEIVGDKKKIIAELKASAKTASSIILATDPDREGEAIASHVADILKIEGRKSKIGVEDRKLKVEQHRIDLPSSTVYHLPSITRIVFHEITKEAIEEALKNPRSINKNLVDAQTARRVLDRIVGYKLSPLLWKKVRRGLSAGRVQSVALRLIVEREREIEKFGKEKYWSISAFLAQGPATRFPPVSAPHSQSSEVRAVGSPSSPVTLRSDSTEFELIEINGEKIELTKSFALYDGEYKITKTTIDSQKKAQEIVSDLKTKNFIVADVLQKESKRSPAPPYTTSTLQQDAARRLGISGRRTMSLAQKLYEEGYITYHRTDSVVIGSAAMFAIINFVKKTYGEKYVPENPRFYTAKQKLAQEAHEAIRPTKMGELQSQISNLKSQIGASYAKLYELIWRRAMASQMSDALVESTTVLVDAIRRQPRVSDDARLQNSENQSLNSASLSKSRLPTGTPPTFSSSESGLPPRLESDYRLKTNGSVLVFDGFLKVNPLGLSDNKLPKFSAKQNLNLIEVLEKEHETLPPPRYNDASIIKTLEEKGIGRPSTYATIISTIESRGYIERGNPSTGSGRGFGPTAVGIAVNDFLVKNFSEIDDIPFTAAMEDSLDEIAHGQKEWVPMMKDFYTPFEKKLVEVERAERVKIAVEKTNEKCPTCGSPLVIRTGRFGKFFACSKFPECKFTKAFVEETNLTCPKDGGKIVIKKTRRGRRFYGCSNYPKCDFAAWKLEDIKKNSEKAG